MLASVPKFPLLTFSNLPKHNFSNSETQHRFPQERLWALLLSISQAFDMLASVPKFPLLTFSLVQGLTLTQPLSKLCLKPTYFLPLRDLFELIHFSAAAILSLEHLLALTSEPKQYIFAPNS